MASFVRDFRAAGVLVPASAGAARFVVAPYSRFGELWVQKTWRTLHTDSGADRAYFEPLESIKRTSQPSKKYTAVTKENVPGSARIAPQ